MNDILQLSQIRKKDLSLAGGKGANLGELLQAGFPVPSGFVLLTSSYRDFVEHNALHSEISQLANSLLPNNPGSAEQISSLIRALFHAATFPEDLVEAIALAYKSLEGKAVVVRSSSTAEDLLEASFAGQHESYLNIRSFDELLESIRRCWSSLWTGRALLYRVQHHIAAEHVSQAVVVQRMVCANRSGVLFTANPLNGRQDEIVINATWGLGEALVSGEITPDMIVVDKTSGQVEQITIGSKEWMTIPLHKENGTTRIAVSLEQQRQSVLTAEQIAELVALGIRVETYFGSPQDIEWAATDQRIYLVQARPITTSVIQQEIVPRSVPTAPGDDSWDREQDLPAQAIDLWTRTNVGENLPFPITPLTQTNFGAVFGLDKVNPKQSYQPTRRIYGRLYLNEGGMVTTFNADFGLPASLLTLTLGTTRRSQYPNSFHPLRLIRKLPELLGSSNTIKEPKKAFPKHNAEQFFAQINTWVSEFRAIDLSTLSDQELWQNGLPLWRPRGEYAFATNLRISMQGSLYYVLSWLVTRWTGQKNLGHTLITSPSGMLSSDIGLALWQMAHCLKELHLEQVLLDEAPGRALERLRALPEAQPFVQMLADFLTVHGHRCPNELELLNPRWEEAPEQVIELVGNYLLAGQQVNPAQAQRQQQARRAETIAQIEKKIGPLRRLIFRRLLLQVQQAITVRENSKYHMSKFLFPLRLLYAELGRRWQERSWFQHADDIFFLVIREIQQLCEESLEASLVNELQDRIAQRQIAYNFWLTIQAPDAIDSEGKTIVDDDASTTLVGVAASSGRVRGRARLVHTVEEAMRLQPGDILVTMSTDPGWTPVFPLVSGLVLEIGGQLSHGAIIAREFGLPAVINVPGAMRRIQDGQLLEIDGSNGRIYLTPSPHEEPLLH